MTNIDVFVNRLTETRQSRLEQKLALAAVQAPPEGPEFWWGRSMFITAAIRKDLADLGRVRRKPYIAALKARDTDAMAAVFGGTRALLNRHHWLSDLPGFINSPKTAGEQLDHVLRIASKIKLPRYTKSAAAS